MDIVEILLDHPVELEAKDEYGATALIIAAYRGHLDIVKTLLGAGAEVHAQDRNGWTAMVWAVSRRHNNVVDFLKTYVKK